MRRSLASTIRFSGILARTVLALPTLRPWMMSRIQTPECELVVGGSLSVETREFGGELIRHSVNRYLRISSLWRLARRIRDLSSFRLDFNEHDAGQSL